MILQANRNRIKDLFDIDSQAFITAAGIVDTIQKNAINELVKGLKSYGLWSKGYCFYPMVGGTASAHKWNLFNPVNSDSAYRGVFIGGWTHSANGAKGNGINGYMNTKLIPSSVLTAGDTAFVYSSRTSGSANGSEYGCAYDSGATPDRINLHVSFAGTLYSDLYKHSSGRLSTPNANGDGIYVCSRTSTTIHKVFKNGVQLGSTDTTPSGNLSLLTMPLGLNGLIFASGSGYYSARECSGAGVFEGLTDSNCVDLNDLIDNFNSALSR